MELTATQLDDPQNDSPPLTASVAPVPEALRWALAAAGAELEGDIELAARILVDGLLTPRSRARYGTELRVVSGWCREHGLDLMRLSSLDIAALAVACREGGCDPDPALTALSFVYRHKPDPQESVTGLARRVDKAWRAQNRDRLPTRRRAPVLPLSCWAEMHAAVGGGGYLGRPHAYDRERVARDRLIISLGVSGGPRPGELGRLSLSRSGVENGTRLVLGIVADERGAATKTGRGHIVVPLRVPPFDVLPLEDDFRRLRNLRQQRGGDDYLVTNLWHYGIGGGLSETHVSYILRKAARHAGVGGGEHLSGYSMRRSMAHISVAAGWPLEKIAAVMGHAGTRELQQHYLDGYCGSWCRSDEGRRMLLVGSDGWQDSPLNTASSAAAAPDIHRGPWWSGRDLEADRERAMALARGSARTCAKAAARTRRIAKKWESFCEGAGLDPAEPSATRLEVFAMSLAEGATANRDNEIRYLADHFAAQPQTDVEDLSDISRWVSNAAALAAGITAANRRQARHTPRRREIVHVTDEMMTAVFAVPLTAPLEGVRLLGLALSQAHEAQRLTLRQREAFRFGEHARIAGDTAELLAPIPSNRGSVRRPEPQQVAIRVPRSGGDPLWCGMRAVESLMAHYPCKSLVSKCPPGTLTSQCTPLIGFLRARAAVAVLHATGLRPTDLDGIRWPDLRASDDGSIMWRLPYSKGNLVGDRVQILRLQPTGDPWCPVSALTQLAHSLTQAQAAGWNDQRALPDRDGATTRVFCNRISDEITKRLMKPAGVAVRAQDFRYHKAARLWLRTQDIQQVRTALFHRSEHTSMIYVSRGLPLSQRVETDPMSGVFPDTRVDGTGSAQPQ